MELQQNFEDEQQIVAPASPQQRMGAGIIAEVRSRDASRPRASHSFIVESPFPPSFFELTRCDVPRAIHTLHVRGQRVRL